MTGTWRFAGSATSARRRALRIFPLYFAVLGRYVLLVMALERNSVAGREFVGSASNGIYLLHMLVKGSVVKLLAATGVPANDYLVFVLTTAGSIAVAAISFRYFESYFLRRKASYAVPA